MRAFKIFNVPKRCMVDQLQSAFLTQCGLEITHKLKCPNGAWSRTFEIINVPKRCMEIRFIAFLISRHNSCQHVGRVCFVPQSPLERYNEMQSPIYVTSVNSQTSITFSMKYRSGLSLFRCLCFHGLISGIRKDLLQSCILPQICGIVCGAQTIWDASVIMNAHTLHAISVMILEERRNFQATLLCILEFS